MEHVAINEKQQNVTEHLVLMFFTLYDISIFYLGVAHKWDLWAVLLVVLCSLSSWAIYFMRYKTYYVRAMLTTVLIQICLLLYANYSEDFSRIIPTFFVIGSVIVMYGIGDLVMISNAVQFFLIIVFLFTGMQNYGEEVYRATLPQIGNIAIYMFFIHFLVKKRTDTAKQNAQIIKDLIKAERSKDDFLANISHEIRTPLNTVLGMSQMALKQDDINVIKEEVYNIEVASKMLMSMVNDILDFSELQSGEMDLEEEVFNVTSTVTDIVSMTMALVEDKELDVIVDVDPNMPAMLCGDEKKIRRIIMNLISNAVKYTKAGYINIKVSGRIESYGINLFVSVTDTGMGMKPEHVAKLFTGFEQVDTRRTRQEGGVGLGLAISSLLARKMGGVINVSSKEGVGSVFSLVVPLKIVGQQQVASVNYADKINMACFFNDKEEFNAEARDAYKKQMSEMVKNIPISWHFCRNFEELKRRMATNDFSHVLVSHSEYEKNKEFFDTIVDKAKVIISVSRNNLNSDINVKAIPISKPIYAIPLISVLNDEYDIAQMDNGYLNKAFVAPNAHILVVDDNLMNIRVVENVLAPYQIRVTRALSGSEALDKVESKAFDFIFMDHMMPGMDGIEAMHRIRAMAGSYFQNIPIIALTANAVAGSRKMFISEGFTDFIEKPVELSVLDRVLRRNLPVEKIRLVGQESLNEKNANLPVKVENNVVTQADYNEAKEEESTMNVMDISMIPEVDRETGMMYCGGEAGFYMILAECVMGTMETAKELIQLFEKKDWPNYIIKIHALKSTMKSIGIMGISDRAKELEFAGKEGKYDVIEEKNQAVVDDYVQIMKKIYRVQQIQGYLEEGFSFDISDEDRNELSSTDELLEISQEDFDALSHKFDDAMYSLDADTMLEVIRTFEKYKFGGKVCKVELSGMRRKVEQDDFFSAGSDIAILREFLEGGNPS